MNLRSSVIVCAVLFAALVPISRTQAQPLVTIETVTVGNPGNTADSTGYGAVTNAYLIGKYEVTHAQYTAFLNAVTDRGLYNSNMTNANTAGIARTGSPGNFSYSVIGSGNQPVTFVSWYDAARFCNWLHNGATNGADTETGAYTLSELDEFMVPRNADAKWWIPNENEWYKAAFYDPSVGGPSDDYWLYPTRSDSAPGNVNGAQTNRVNYRVGSLYSVTQSAIYSAAQNYLTDVGSFSGSSSYYGTFDQAGNVAEIVDTTYPGGEFLVLRGGAWSSTAASVLSGRGSTGPADESESIGFRVATAGSLPDTTPPVITLIGENPIVVTIGGSFTDPGANVTDNVDAARTITGTGDVDTTIPGDYTLTYNATDAAGNAATAVTRTVQVLDPLNHAPVASGTATLVEVPLGVTNQAPRRGYVGNLFLGNFSDTADAGRTNGLFVTRDRWQRHNLTSREFGNGFAFAALKSDGSVVTWGDTDFGGNSSAVTSQLSGGVIEIFSAGSAFAALKSDGSVVTWGNSSSAGNSSAVASQLTGGVIEIFSAGSAFAALKSNGSVVTWGFSSDGGDSSAVASQLSGGVIEVFSTGYAFAALKTNGAVVTWGKASKGGNSSAAASQLNGRVVEIFSTDGAFAALKSNGSVWSWGDSFSGGDDSLVGASLNEGVIEVFSTGNAFAALKSNGSVVTWGGSSSGGNSSAVASQLASGVVEVFSTGYAFAALKSDGAVVTWGNATYGGDSSAVASQLTGGVVQIFSTVEAFAALKSDGSVVTWGSSANGGNSSAVAAQLAGGVTTLASPVERRSLVLGNALAGVAVVSNAATSAQGVWQYSADGFNWLNVSTGLSDAAALILDTKAQLRFVRAGGFADTPGGLSLRLIETGGSSAPTTGTTANFSGVNNGGFTRVSAATVPLTYGAIPEPEIALIAINGLANNEPASSFGTILVGAPPLPSLTYTMRNDGNIALNISSFAVSGANASDFLVVPLITNQLAAGASTNFFVSFVPSGGGIRTAQISITSNDIEHSPFIINLSGFGLGEDTDTDGDGLNDAAEFTMSSLGFNWQLAQTNLVGNLYSNAHRANLFDQAAYDANRTNGVGEGIGMVQANPSGYGLYTADSIMDLRMGGLMVQRQGSSAIVTFQPQTTTNLTQPFTNNGAPITNEIPMPGNKGFIRIRANPTPVPTQ